MSDPQLVPPRPFFLAATPRTRRSASSEPPSAFPFQAYAGNADPLPSRRRVSIDSQEGYTSDGTLPRTGSLSDLHRPQPPFAADHPLTTSSSSSSLYRASAAAPIASTPPLSPAQVFRPPFLSPASRPQSSLSWAPPNLDPTNSSSTALHLSPSGSNIALGAAQHRPPLPSTLLEKSAGNSQVSFNEKDGGAGKPPQAGFKRHRPSCFLTLACILLGIAGAAILCYKGVANTKANMLDESQLCLVMQEDFTGSDLNDAYWTKEIQVDDRGFQVNTASSKNLYLQNGQLYIFPTLMRDENPQYDQDGQSYDVDGCTAFVAAPEPAPDTTNDNSTTTDDDGNGNGGTATTSAVRGGGTQAAGNGNGGGGNGQQQQQHNRRQNTGNNGGNGGNGGNGNNGGNGDDDDNNGNGGNSNNSTNTPAPTTAAPVGNLCRALTNSAAGTVINPVLSGRITTKGKVGMKYGRVEVVAKVARGDWLWPAVWMLPENDTYGAWPLSGEIDIIETRGNSPSYPAQGSNYIRSALEYGLDKTLTPIDVPGAGQPAPLTKDLFGWFALKRTSFDKGFHTYTLEWDEKFVRFWVDGRVRSILDVGVDQKKNSASDGNGNNGNGGKKKRGGTFWEKGKFPATAQNKTTGAVVVVQDPWLEGGPAAPFDQRFYLNIDLGVGGRTGWFPDDEGGKPWYDGSNTAMRDFNKDIDTWYTTWPENPDDRAFRIESVKMWSKGC